MGLRSTTMVLEAKRDVKYRYICQKCDVNTEWFASVVYAHNNYTIKYGRFKVNAEYDPSVIDKKKSVALERLEKSTSVLTKILNDSTGEYNFPGEYVSADLYNKTFSAGKACPNCGWQQSWYPMDTTHRSILKYIKAYVLSLLIFGNILGLVFIMAYTSVHSMPSIYIIPGFQIVLLSLGWILGIVRGNYLIWKRKSVRKRQTKRNVPEVVWGAITVDTLGIDQLDYDDKGVNVAG